MARIFTNEFGEERRAFSRAEAAGVEMWNRRFVRRWRRCDDDEMTTPSLAIKGQHQTLAVEAAGPQCVLRDHE